MARSFFETTAAYKRQNTSLFDFTTPTAAAIWNLRWQVRGYLQVAPDATKADLEGRFLTGADNKKLDLRRANLRRAAIEQSWEEQLEQFARYMLFAVVGMYEGWLEQTMASFPRPGARVKQLQFPSRGIAGRTEPGVAEGLAAATVHHSPMMNSSFAEVLRLDSKYSANRLDHLLVCYRYFKECRNALLHQGGAAGTELVKYSLAMHALTANDLGTKAVPEHALLLWQDPVRITLRGVTGFSEVVLRIVTTIDAELSATQQAEEDFVRRWRHRYGRPMLPVDPARRDRRIARMSEKLGLPTPAFPSDAYKTLRAANAVA